MPLESVVKPADLNENWPLNGDPATQGAAHLRSIKRALKGNILGGFASRAAFKEWFEAEIAKGWQPQSSCLFTISGKWYSLDSIAEAANHLDNEDFFPVAAGLRAVNISRNRTFGQANGSGIFEINSPEKRRAFVRDVVLEGTPEDFDVTAANAAFPNNAPVANDVCLQRSVTVPVKSFIRIYNGTSWIQPDLEAYNQLVAFGLLAAVNVQAKNIDAWRVRAHKHEVLGETKLYIIDPEAFGPDEVIMWYGEKDTVVNPNGEVNYSALLKANAIRWRNVDGVEGGRKVSDTPVDQDTVAVDPALGGLGTSYAAESFAYFSGSAYAQVNVTLNSTGQFAIAGFDIISGNPTSGNYLTEVGENAGQQMLVRATTNKAWAIQGAPLNTWLPLTQNRTFALGISKHSQGFDSNDATLTLEVKKGEAGTVVSKTINLAVTATVVGGASGGGIIP
jgi:hypothetical protein